MGFLPQLFFYDTRDSNYEEEEKMPTYQNGGINPYNTLKKTQSAKPVLPVQPVAKQPSVNPLAPPQGVVYSNAKPAQTVQFLGATPTPNPNQNLTTATHIPYKAPEKVGRYYTDKQINDIANETAYQKYGAGILDVNNEMNSARTNYSNQKKDVEKAYQQGVVDASNTGAEDKARSAERINALGLANSSVLTNSMDNITRNTENNKAKMAQDKLDTINKIDTELNTLIANLNSKKSLLTQQQKTEAQLMIRDLMKERQDQKTDYEKYQSQLKLERDRMAQQAAIAAADRAASAANAAASRALEREKMKNDEKHYQEDLKLKQDELNIKNAQDATDLAHAKQKLIDHSVVMARTGSDGKNAVNITTVMQTLMDAHTDGTLSDKEYSEAVQKVNQAYYEYKQNNKKK